MQRRRLPRLFDPAGAIDRPTFDGLNYGYDVDGGTYLLWSSGPDGESGTGDDISATNQR